MVNVTVAMVTVYVNVTSQLRLSGRERMLEIITQGHVKSLSFTVVK